MKNFGGYEAVSSEESHELYRSTGVRPFTVIKSPLLPICSCTLERVNWHCSCPCHWRGRSWIFNWTDQIWWFSWGPSPTRTSTAIPQHGRDPLDSGRPLELRRFRHLWPWINWKCLQCKEGISLVRNLWLLLEWIRGEGWRLRWNWSLFTL